jgi:ABC-type multidrug transport system fused ATPase/permease subunit
MNENFKKVMDAIADMKAMFSTSAEATETTEAQAFGEAVLLDGTAVSYEGELAVGTTVFIVADGEQIPAPEGTHELGGEFTGIKIITDANGVVLEVIDERATEQAASSNEFEAIDTEEMPAALERATEAIAATLNIEMGQAYDIATAVIAAINAEEMKEESMSAEQVESIVNAKMSSFSTAVEAIGEMMQTIASDNETLRTEMAAMKNDFESFKAMPSNSTTESEKFARTNANLTSRQLFLKSQIK